jgi:large subunit ribosomal protein L6
MVHVIKVSEEIEIPSGVTFTLEGKVLTAKGKLGSLTKDFTHARTMNITLEDNIIRLNSDFPRQSTIALSGTLRNIIKNMILGVTEGYTYKMKIVFSHFPISVDVPKDTKTPLAIKNFGGERSPRHIAMIPDVKVESTKEEVTVSGVDKEQVGIMTARIQRSCRFHNKDKRVFQDGIYVYEKYCGTKQLWAIK